MKQNRILICILSAGIIILFTFISTVLWYKFFNKNIGNQLIVNQLYMSNNGKQVIDEIGIDNKDILNNSSATYSFSIENTSKQNIAYKLLIHEISPSLLTDGCKQENLLVREQLVYQITLNGKVIIKDDMANIEDNTIDIRTIKAGAINNYELSFWVKDSQKDYLNKHYHYEVNLSV